jgi:hypothetical protein
MHTESPTQHEIQADEIISEGDVMTCPGCKREGPKSIYCNFCGYPLYMVGADETEETAEDEIVSEFESDEGERFKEAGIEHPTPAIESLEEERQVDDHEESVDIEVRARAKETLDRILAIFKGSNTKKDNKKS